MAEATALMTRRDGMMVVKTAPGRMRADAPLWSVKVVLDSIRLCSLAFRQKNGCHIPSLNYTNVRLPKSRICMDMTAVAGYVRA